MHRRIGGVLCLFMMGLGCGYVGPVLPPSPQIPSAITDLTVVERGDRLFINFTAPARTIDGVAITYFTNIDLRLGPEQQNPQAAKAYEVELPPESERDDPQPKPMTKEIPAAEWTGRRIAVEVRTSARKTGHFSAWSNKVVLNVLAPLPRPVVQATSSADGIVLTWEPVIGVKYSVFRQGQNDKQPVDLGLVDTGRFVDKSADYDTPYRYTVTAKEDAAESAAFVTEAFTAKDEFAPAVPSGLTALAGPDGVNLAWQRNTEADLQGYDLYRSENGGAFQRQGGLITLPAFSDHNVQAGKTYRYQVSSIDKKANESRPSAAVEVQF